MGHNLSKKDEPTYKCPNEPDMDRINRDVLLLKFLRSLAKYGWKLSNLVALIRLNLFVKLACKSGLTTLLPSSKQAPAFHTEGVSPFL